MAPDKLPLLESSLSHWLMTWCGRLRPPRSPWVYVLVAVGLLGASELLWLWHSWPVREILDTEKLVAGTAV